MTYFPSFIPNVNERPLALYTISLFPLYPPIGTNIKIIEKSGMRKDRYSSLAYNYWVQCQLEREMLRKQKTGFDASDYASKLRRLNKRPNTY